MKGNSILWKGDIEMIEKQVFIVNGLTGSETPIRVREGATPMDIVKKLGLPGYQLARVKDRQVLSSCCDVSRQVENKQRLFAFAPMTVGG